MSRVFKSSKFRLSLFVPSADTISNLKISLYTDDPKIATDYNDLDVDGHIVSVIVEPSDMLNMNEGVINYIAEGDNYIIERQSNYMLKNPSSYVNGDSDVDANLITITHIVDKETMTLNASDFHADGFSSVNIDATLYGNNKYYEGYNVGKSEAPVLEELNVEENGTYNGAFNIVNVNVQCSSDETKSLTIPFATLSDGYFTPSFNHAHFEGDRNYLNMGSLYSFDNDYDINEYNLFVRVPKYDNKENSTLVAGVIRNSGTDGVYIKVNGDQLHLYLWGKTAIVDFNRGEWFKITIKNKEILINDAPIKMDGEFINEEESTSLYFGAQPDYVKSSVYTDFFDGDLLSYERIKYSYEYIYNETWDEIIGQYLRTIQKTYFTPYQYTTDSPFGTHQYTYFDEFENIIDTSVNLTSLGSIFHYTYVEEEGDVLYDKIISYKQVSLGTIDYIIPKDGDVVGYNAQDEGLDGYRSVSITPSYALSKAYEEGVKTGIKTTEGTSDSIMAEVNGVYQTFDDTYTTYINTPNSTCWFRNAWVPGNEDVVEIKFRWNPTYYNGRIQWLYGKSNELYTPSAKNKYGLELNSNETYAANGQGWINTWHGKKISKTYFNLYEWTTHLTYMDDDGKRVVEVNGNRTGRYSCSLEEYTYPDYGLHIGGLGVDSSEILDTTHFRGDIAYIKIWRSKYNWENNPDNPDIAITPESYNNYGEGIEGEFIVRENEDIRYILPYTNDKGKCLFKEEIGKKYKNWVTVNVAQKVEEWVLPYVDFDYNSISDYINAGYNELYNKTQIMTGNSSYGMLEDYRYPFVESIYNNTSDSEITQLDSLAPNGNDNILYINEIYCENIRSTTDAFINCNFCIRKLTNLGYSFVEEQRVVLPTYENYILGHNNTTGYKYDRNKMLLDLVESLYDFSWYGPNNYGVSTSTLVMPDINADEAAQRALEKGWQIEYQ